MEQGWLIKKNKKTKTETAYLALCLQATAERPKLGEKKKKTWKKKKEVWRGEAHTCCHEAGRGTIDHCDITKGIFAELGWHDVANRKEMDGLF